MPTIASSTHERSASWRNAPGSTRRTTPTRRRLSSSGSLIGRAVPDLQSRNCEGLSRRWRERMPWSPSGSRRANT
jgi:hypothetical protein